jgi:MFS family permease
MASPQGRASVTPERRAHAGAALALFSGLGFHIGLWAVLIPDVAGAADLRPATLGLCIGLVSLSGMAALLTGGPLSDRFGRRPVGVAGCLGLAGAFCLLAAVGPWPVLVGGLVLLGVGGGLLDLAANATGSDYERAHAVRAMTGLHGAFSAAAAAGALLAAGVLGGGGSFRAAFLATAALLAVLAVVVARVRLPPRGPGAAGVGEPPSAVAAPAERGGPAGTAAGRLWAVPGVRLGLFLAGICFLGDGMLEGFTSLYLRGELDSGVWIGGGAIAAFHLASLAGRLIGARAIRRRGERLVVRLAGLGAAAGMALTVLAPSPGAAAVGLLLVGLSLAPVVPTALSVAGRSAPERSGAAVSLVSTAGYGAFIAGPAIVGLLADATSLRVALAPVVLSAVAIAVLSTWLPAGRSTPAR